MKRTETIIQLEKRVFHGHDLYQGNIIAWIFKPNGCKKYGQVWCLGREKLLDNLILLWIAMAQKRKVGALLSNFLSIWDP